MHCELSDSTKKDTPGASASQLDAVVGLGGPDQDRCNDGDVPQHRCHITQEEVAVCVQDAKAPCSEDNETNTWCHGPDEFGNEVSAGVASAADDEPHDWACSEHEHQHDGSH